MRKCEDCLHFEVCDALERCNGVPKISSYDCGCYENTTSIQKAKQEVAREIIREADTALHDMAHEYINAGHPEYFAVCEMVYHKVIRRIEKKYTEGEQNE